MKHHALFSSVDKSKTNYSRPSEFAEYIFRTINSFCANQTDLIKNFAVVMSAAVYSLQFAWRLKG